MLWLILSALSPAHAADDTVVEFRLQSELRGRLADGRLRGTQPLDAVQHVVDRWGLTLTPLHGPDADELLRRAEALSGRVQPDLRGTYRLEPAMPEGQRAQVMAELEATGQTAWVDAVPLRPPPPADIAPATPSYDSQQITHDPVGGGLDGALIRTWSAGIRISDVEYGWKTAHEDLEDGDLSLEAGVTVPGFVSAYGWDDHGTAVVGLLGATDDGYGCTGITADASFGLYPEYDAVTGSRRAAAITSAALDSLPGDVVLLEMQTNGLLGSYGPAEISGSVWDATRVAVDAGIHVVAAAGNGAEDLDDPAYQGYRDRGDSGAILVGAGTPETAHDAYWFSTYGQRVSLQGWGSDVFTLGYGDYALLGGDPLQSYTHSFTGTSSASPMVTAAVAGVSGYAIATFGEPLSPAALRRVLVDTGIPQGSGDPIGPFPDVAAAIAALDADLDGALSATYGGDDCDETDSLIGPNQSNPTVDGIDQDCDGMDGPPLVLVVGPPAGGGALPWSISEASPGADIGLLMGTPGSAIVGGCAIDIQPPRPRDRLTADAYGNGAETLQLPAQAPSEAMVQAVERGTCRVSEPVLVPIR